MKGKQVSSYPIVSPNSDKIGIGVKISVLPALTAVKTNS